MKKLLILPILATVLFANSEERSETLISEYKTMFDKIGEKRFGVNEREIDALREPFVMVKKVEKSSPVTQSEKPSSPFLLQAIVNKQVKISDKWYPLNGEVNGMKIISINDNHVWLKNDEYRKKLTLGSKNEKISIK